MLAGQILYSLLALQCDRNPDNGSAGAGARSALPALILPWAIAFNAHLAKPHLDVVYTLLVSSALFASLQAQWLVRKAPPAPQDSVSAMLEFESGASGLLATVRATPFYWRVHAFGTKGNAEVLGETELVLRMSGKPLQRLQLAPAADSLRAELEAFADAVDKRAPFPVAPAEMLQTVGAFEAVIRALG